jgi:DNA (cytosine-5)-methyltransferase 1
MSAPIRYLSVCSGIEAWTVASEGLGYQAVAFSEIDKFASAVLAHRFGSNLPGEPWSGNAPPNVGDFTTLLDEAVRSRLPAIDVLVGGTPCQAFSFAGKRLSLADVRGNLTLAFAVLMHELARSHGLRNAVWENVPGVLSTPDNAFGCFLGALVGADAPLDLPAGIGRWPDAGMVAGPRARAAWRVLDAQYFGLAQRRERVLLVVDPGGGADPAAVLFEPQGLRGNTPPRREKGEKPAATVAGGARSRGGYSHDDVPLTAVAFGGNNTSGPIEVATALSAHGGPMGRMDFESETFIAHTLRGEGFDASEDGTGRGIPLVPVVVGPLTAAMGRQNGCTGPEGAAAGHLVPVALRGHSDYGDGLPCLRAEGGDVGGCSEALIAFDTTQITSAPNRSNPTDGDPCHPLAASAHPPAIAFPARMSGTQFASTIELAPALGAANPTAIAFSCKDHGADAGEDIAPTLRAMGHGESHPNAGGQVAVAFSIMPQNSGKDYKARAVEVAQPLMAGGPVGGNQGGDYVLQHWRVRRLTPPECARLQGFPDDHSRIPWRGKTASECPDGPQYKTYGNSMATKKMRWLAQRLAELMRARAA